jgi:hypothetical protein
MASTTTERLIEETTLDTLRTADRTAGRAPSESIALGEHTPGGLSAQATEAPPAAPARGRSILGTAGRAVGGFLGGALDVASEVAANVNPARGAIRANKRTMERGAAMFEQVGSPEAKDFAQLMREKPAQALEFVQQFAGGDIRKLLGMFQEQAQQQRVQAMSQIDLMTLTPKEVYDHMLSATGDPAASFRAQAAAAAAQPQGFPTFLQALKDNGLPPRNFTGESVQRAFSIWMRDGKVTPEVFAELDRYNPNPAQDARNENIAAAELRKARGQTPRSTDEGFLELRNNRRPPTVVLGSPLPE